MSLYNTAYAKMQYKNLKMTVFIHLYTIFGNLYAIRQYGLPCFALGLCSCNGNKCSNTKSKMRDNNKTSANAEI